MGRIGWPWDAWGGRAVRQLELAETVEALRAELARAAAAGAGTGFQFPVDGVQMEFHVGVTVTLGSPVDQSGHPVKIYHGSAEKP